MNNRPKYKDKLNAIGGTIKHYRELNNLSLTQLSDKLQLIGIDIPKNSLHLIEKGERAIREFELAGLSIIFGVTTDELLTDILTELKSLK